VHIPRPNEFSRIDGDWINPYDAHSINVARLKHASEASALLAGACDVQL
jgi:hypothetical protein